MPIALETHCKALLLHQDAKFNHSPNQIILQDTSRYYPSKYMIVFITSLPTTRSYFIPI
jgi:hypothetical protein